MIVTPPHAHRVFLEGAKTGGRLAGVDNARTGPRNDIGIVTTHRSHPAEPLEEVERDSLTRQQIGRRSTQPQQDVANNESRTFVREDIHRN